MIEILHRLVKATVPANGALWSRWCLWRWKWENRKDSYDRTPRPSPKSSPNPNGTYVVFDPPTEPVTEDTSMPISLAWMSPNDIRNIKALPEKVKADLFGEQWEEFKEAFRDFPPGESETLRW